ncbi:MAG: PilN domain-containing protein [Pseudazoarcus pumilus]|nr:PilN domain-containing protein [Pseudazoarcus pumilus]
MIRINLLPYREVIRRERRRQFYVVSGLMVALGAAIGLVGHLYMTGKVEHQEGRNQFLRAEIATLNTQIAEIARLRAQIDALVARKQVIETLQENRVQSVYMFNDLVTHVPDGVFVRTLSQSGNRITLSGNAQSNARVSHLMRSLESAPTMSSPILVEVKSITDQGRRLSDFTLSVGLNRPDASDPGAK